MSLEVFRVSRRFATSNNNNNKFPQESPHFSDSLWMYNSLNQFLPSFIRKIYLHPLLIIIPMQTKLTEKQCFLLEVSALVYMSM